jgi:hypothetical protein
MEHARKFIKRITDAGESFGSYGMTEDAGVLYDIRQYTGGINENKGTLKYANKAGKESGVAKMLSVGFEAYVQLLISNSNWRDARQDFPDWTTPNNFVSGYNYGVPPSTPETDEEYGFDWCQNLEDARGGGTGVNDDDVVS